MKLLCSPAQTRALGHLDLQLNTTPGDNLLVNYSSNDHFNSHLHSPVPVVFTPLM